MSNEILAQWFAILTGYHHHPTCPRRVSTENGVSAYWEALEKLTTTPTGAYSLTEYEKALLLAEQELDAMHICRCGLNRRDFVTMPERIISLKLKRLPGDQRQLLALALAQLALDRPGWNLYIREIARELEAERIFENCLAANRDRFKALPWPDGTRREPGEKRK